MTASICESILTFQIKGCSDGINNATMRKEMLNENVLKERDDVGTKCFY